MFLELVLLLVLTYLIYNRLKQHELLKHAANIPGDTALPFVGNAIQFYKVKNNKDVFYKIREIAETYSEHGICKLWMAQTLIVLVWDPSYLEILATSPHASTKGPYYRLVVGHSLQGITTSPGGQAWKELRKPLTMTMTKNNLEHVYYNVFIRRINDFKDFIIQNREGKNWDTMNDISALFLDIFVETHLGVSSNEVWDRKVNATLLFERLIKLSEYTIFKYGFYLWQYALKFTGESSQFEKDKKDYMKYMKWLLDERKKISLENSDGQQEYYTDFLNKRRIEKNLSEEQVCKELGDLVVAGSDTSSIFTASAIVFLAMFPEVQEKAYQEQLAIFGDSDRDPTLEDIYAMKYLEMVFKETSRHMGNPGVLKSCTGDIKLVFVFGNQKNKKNYWIGVKLSFTRATTIKYVISEFGFDWLLDNLEIVEDSCEYTVPKGAALFLFFNQTHRDPKLWERPYEFYPEHFLPEKESSRHRFAYNIFGLGLRMCAGKTYGLVSSIMFLSTILRNFKMTTPIKFEEIRYEFSIFLSMQPGYTVKYESRRQVLKND